MTRVLIVSAQALFGEAVETWLRQQRDLDVIAWEAEAGLALSRIQQLEPDVIILDTAAFPKSPTAALMKFLSDRSDGQIIGLDLRNNCVSIFEREQQVTRQLGALLNVLSEQGMASTDDDPRGHDPALEALRTSSAMSQEVT